MNAHAALARTASLAECAVYEAAAVKLEGCLTHYMALRSAIAGMLPLPAAEALMDDIEGYLDIVGVGIKRADDMVGRELIRIGVTL